MLEPPVVPDVPDDACMKCNELDCRCPKCNLCGVSLTVDVDGDYCKPCARKIYFTEPLMNDYRTNVFRERLLEKIPRGGPADEVVNERLKEIEAQLRKYSFSLGDLQILEKEIDRWHKKDNQ